MNKTKLEMAIFIADTLFGKHLSGDPSVGPDNWKVKDLLKARKNPDLVDLYEMAERVRGGTANSEILDAPFKSVPAVKLEWQILRGSYWNQNVNEKCEACGRGLIQAGHPLVLGYYFDKDGVCYCHDCVHGNRKVDNPRYEYQLSLIEQKVRNIRADAAVGRLDRVYITLIGISEVAQKLAMEIDETEGGE